MAQFTEMHSDPELIRKGRERHQQLIGYIGLFLPLLLIFMVKTRDGEKIWGILDSISAYYYTGAVAAFVGMLVALALFLFTYDGFQTTPSGAPNKFHRADRAAGIIAGFAALGVALFPTEAPSEDLELVWWTETMGRIHFVSAIVLFAMFAVYALWLFRYIPKGEQTRPDRWWRNHLYLACGIVIVASIVWAIVEYRRGDGIFWPESIALVAFAVSWLFKGDFEATIGKGASKAARKTRSILKRQATGNN